MPSAAERVVDLAISHALAAEAAQSRAESSELAPARRRAELMQVRGLRKALSAPELARLMTMARQQLTRADNVIIAIIEAGVPGLADARRLVDRFRTMIRIKAVDGLEEWIEQTRTSPIAPLA